MHLRQEVILLDYLGRKSPPHPATTHPMGDCHSSANEKSLYFKLSVSSNGLFLYNSPYQVYKEQSTPLFFKLGWFAIRLPIPNFKSLLFPNKPILIEKYRAIC